MSGELIPRAWCSKAGNDDGATEERVELVGDGALKTVSLLETFSRSAALRLRTIRTNNIADSKSPATPIVIADAFAMLDNGDVLPKSVLAIELDPVGADEEDAADD